MNMLDFVDRGLTIPPYILEITRRVNLAWWDDGIFNSVQFTCLGTGEALTDEEKEIIRNFFAPIMSPLTIVFKEQ